MYGIKNRRHPYAALQKRIKKFCNKLMALGICLNDKIMENDNWQSTWEGITLEVVLVWKAVRVGLMIHHFRFFFFSGCFLKFSLTV